jgi:hypothetical protein
MAPSAAPSPIHLWYYRATDHDFNKSSKLRAEPHSGMTEPAAIVKYDRQSSARCRMIHVLIRPEEESMTMDRLKTICVVVAGALIVAATSCSQNRPTVSQQNANTAAPAPRNLSAEQIAKAYGLDSFGQVEAIRYTWNAQLPGLNASRVWVWEPKTNKVSYEGKDKDGKPMKATYLRSQLDSQPANVKAEVDPAFVNDNYWLLFPFHAYWDKTPTVTDQGEKPLPQGSGSAELVSVKYPSDGGYTPGDTWDLYVGNDNRVQQFVYHRGGPKKPSTVIASWEAYKKAGPLLISTDHHGTADGNPVHISITDIAVKLTGSNNWISAQ